MKKQLVLTIITVVAVLQTTGSLASLKMNKCESTKNDVENSSQIAIGSLKDDSSVVDCDSTGTTISIDENGGLHATVNDTSGNNVSVSIGYSVNTSLQDDIVNLTLAADDKVNTALISIGSLMLTNNAELLDGIVESVVGSNNIDDGLVSNQSDTDISEVHKKKCRSSDITALAAGQGETISIRTGAIRKKQVSGVSEDSAVVVGINDDCVHKSDSGNVTISVKTAN